MLAVCHVGPPAWESQGSAATLPCPQDRAQVLPGSPEQYSQLNICHWQISSVIKPSQVSFASVPEWSEKLAQVTELLRKKVKWQWLWWQGNMGPASAAGWVGGGWWAACLSPDLWAAKGCAPLIWHGLAAVLITAESSLRLPSQPSRGLSLLPSALGHGCAAPVGLLPPLPKSSWLSSCCKGREYSPPLEEQQIYLQRNGHGCPSCTVGSARTRGQLVEAGCLVAIRGENISSILSQITTACYIHVLHSLIAIKAAKKWSKKGYICALNVLAGKFC